MTRPILFPTSVRLTDAHGTAMQFVSFGRGFAPVAIPVGYVPASVPLAPSVGGRAPALVQQAPSVAPRGIAAPVRVAPAAPARVAPAGRTTAAAAPRLRSAVIRQDGTSVTVPVRAEPLHHLIPYLDSLTRSQRRNLKRTMRRTALRKFKRIQAGRALALAPVPVPVPVSAPVPVPVQPVRPDPAQFSAPRLLRGSRFHPLSAAPDAEDAAQIAQASPGPIDFDTSPPSPSRVAYQRRRHLRLVYQRLADQSGQSLSRFLRSAKVQLAEKARRDLLRRDDTDAVQLTSVPRRDRRRFYRQPAVSVQADAYYQVPAISAASTSQRSHAITLTGPDLQGVALPRRKRPRRKARTDISVRAAPPPAPRRVWRVKIAPASSSPGAAEIPSPRDDPVPPQLDGGVVSASAHSSLPSHEGEVAHLGPTASAPPLSRRARRRRKKARVSQPADPVPVILSTASVVTVAPPSGGSVDPSPIHEHTPPQPPVEQLPAQPMDIEPYAPMPVQGPAAPIFRQGPYRRVIIDNDTVASRA